MLETFSSTFLAFLIESARSRAFFISSSALPCFLPEAKAAMNASTAITTELALEKIFLNIFTSRKARLRQSTHIHYCALFRVWPELWRQPRLLLFCHLCSRQALHSAGMLSACFACPTKQNHQACQWRLAKVPPYKRPKASSDALYTA